MRIDPADFTRSASEYDRHDAPSRELLHEPFSQAWIYRIRRAHPGSQVFAERVPARLIMQTRVNLFLAGAWTLRFSGFLSCARHSHPLLKCNFVGSVFLLHA